MIRLVFIFASVLISGLASATPLDFELCKATHQGRYGDAKELIDKGANMHKSFNAFCTYDTFDSEETLYQYVYNQGSIEMQLAFKIKKYIDGTILDVINHFKISNIFDIVSSEDESAKYLVDAAKRKGEYYDTILFILLDFSSVEGNVELTQKQIDFIRLLIDNGMPLEFNSYSIETLLNKDDPRTCANTDSKEIFDCVDLVK